MQFNFEDRCGYRRINWRKPYYAVIANTCVYSLLLYILSERLFPACTPLFDVFMSVSALLLVICCLEDVRSEYVVTKTLNVTSCLYAVFYLAAVIGIHLLL